VVKVFDQRWFRVALMPVAILGVGAVAAGCERPTPGVTLQSGGKVVRSSATAYVRDGKQLAGNERVSVLKARPGASVGIDVDGSVAEKGWTVHITSGSTTLNSSVLRKQNHFSFDVGSATTQIVVSELGQGTNPQALWVFSVQPTLQ
jgi:hypothetical protein